MIKDKTQFPLLDKIIRWENAQEVLHCIKEGEEEIKNVLDTLKQELSSASLEYEQQEIGGMIAECNMALARYGASRFMVNIALNDIKPLLN
jgi:hypothetical protein